MLFRSVAVADGLSGVGVTGDAVQAVIGAADRVGAVFVEGKQVAVVVVGGIIDGPAAGAGVGDAGRAVLRYGQRRGDGRNPGQQENQQRQVNGSA